VQHHHPWQVCLPSASLCSSPDAAPQSAAFLTHTQTQATNDRQSTAQILIWWNTRFGSSAGASLPLKRVIMLEWAHRRQDFIDYSIIKPASMALWSSDLGATVQ